ncbi:MAG TPA: non-homologous end-joining DNA ligase [Acidimicrobiales bacterium]|nr:non-homologous end-joining DNA ligase [Acidimicrobiales bacterium]
MPADTEVEIEGRRLRLSNLDKPLYPDGFTKAQVIDYYARVAAVMLPHLAGRPLTLKRYPNGTEAPFFYEKNCPSHRPDFVPVHPVPRRHGSTQMINYCVAEETATLVWLANLAAIELHPLLARVPDLETPSMMVFDLDPGPPAGMRQCAEVAFLVREMLTSWDLRAFPKTSGSKGLQLYVPINGPTDYDTSKGLAHHVATTLAAAHPNLVVEKMEKAIRPGRVLIDWSQNHPTKTTVGVYSLRARELPRVSTPVTWDEVEAVLSPGADELSFGPAEVLDRIETDGDLFADVEKLSQALPAV